MPTNLLQEQQKTHHKKNKVVLRGMPDDRSPYTQPVDLQVIQTNVNLGKNKRTRKWAIIIDSQGKKRKVYVRETGQANVLKYIGEVCNNFKNPFLGTQALFTNNAIITSQEVYNMQKQSEKRNSDGVRTKDNFDDLHKVRIFNQHEDVCPSNESICPCTKERDERSYKPLVGTAATNSSIKTDSLTEKQIEILQKDYSKKMTLAAKEETLHKTAMYDAVYMMPGKSQWCPKLRNAVSMHTCAFVCPEGRRTPQMKNEQYTDYLMKGGSDEGIIQCGLKQWMETEMDRYYPGWIEDRIKKAGGDVVGSETNYGNRRMNLDEGERRHLPRYPEEKLVEKQLEERHLYSYPNLKFATQNAKINKTAYKDIDLDSAKERELWNMLNKEN